MRLGWCAPMTLAVLAVWPGTAASQNAEQRYRQACDEGTLASCTLLGLMYERGAGVARDPARAATLYARACDGGQLRGCANLGLLHESGTGIGRDLERAAELYGRVCEGGEQLGCDLLAALRRASSAEPAGEFQKTGRVEDAETGYPLAEVVVEVPSLGVRAVSDASGRVDLGRLPAGRHGLYAERFGYEAVGGELEVPGNADFVILLFPASVDDPFAEGRIVGQVLDESGVGLANVEISAGPSGSRTLSDTEGRFTLADVPPGLIEVRFAHLAYAPRSATVVLQPGATVEVSANLATQAIELEPIEVTVRSRFLERSGFYRRAQLGWGTHFSPEDIERIDPIYVSDLVRGRVPGVSVRYDRSGAAYAESRRGTSLTMGPCTLPVYVDGMPAFDGDLDRMPPSWVEAMEVYHGTGTPIEYGECGVILIWTR